MLQNRVPSGQHFAGMHVMLGLAGEHGMQLKCTPVHIFVNIIVHIA
jgi:hypothetical protein